MDAVNSKWVTLNSIVDTSRGTITATINKFAIFAVLAFSSAPGPTDLDTPVAKIETKAPTTSVISQSSPALAVVNSSTPTVSPVTVAANTPTLISTPSVEEAPAQSPTLTGSPSPTSEPSTTHYWPVIIGLIVIIAGITAVAFISSRRST